MTDRLATIAFGVAIFAGAYRGALAWARACERFADRDEPAADEAGKPAREKDA